MRINNSNVKDHFLTECQFSDDEGLGGFKRATLTGFVEGMAYPFLTSIEAFKFARTIPKPTWGEKLREKLPCQVYDLVAGYMGEEKLRMEFSSWNNLGLLYSFVNSKEGFTYHLNIVKFCNNDLDTCPLPPNKTWGEALKEKLPEDVYELVARYMGEERLDKAFTRWSDWFLGVNSFVWGKTKEGQAYFNGVSNFLQGNLDTCPLPPKPELRIMTTIELAGKYLIKKGDWWMVNICNEEIKRYHNNGYKWADHPSSEQFSLMVEV